MLGVLATLTLHRGVQRVRATVTAGRDVHPALDELHALIDSLADDRGGPASRLQTTPADAGEVQARNEHRELQDDNARAVQPERERDPRQQPAARSA